MPTLLDSPFEWSLWSGAGSSWSLLDTSPDRSALERQARSLQALFTNKQFIVVAGTQSPRT
jgi:hypothetical protein